MLMGRLNNERGVSVVLIALSIIVLLGFGAMAIDVAHIYHVKNQLQVAADAAALAGANELQYNLTHGYGYDPNQQPEARQAAFRVACLNTASVADQTINAADCGNNCSYSCTAGNSMPVGLNTVFTSGGTTDDIQFGHYSGGAFTLINTSGGFSLINAVKVTAKRSGAQAYQPAVATWFAKVFSVLGANYDFTNVSASAVAALDKLDIVPIAVNEYWNETPSGSQYPPNQTYPQSFMRATNVDGTTSNMVGKTFAILGQDANKNMVPQDACGYVDVMYRCRFHNNTGFYSVVGASGPVTCATSSCTSTLSYLPGGLKTGTIDITKWDGTGNFGYLFSGIPDNVFPPNAVREYDNNMGRTTYTYDDNTTYGTHTKPPNVDPNIGTNQTNNPQDVANNCPLASLPYYQTSGNPINQSPSPTYKNLTFNVKYPKGTRFMVMVYDGTGSNNPSNQCNNITVVGYSMIEVDGYADGKGSSKKIASLGDKGNTCYGHAVRYYKNPSDITSQPWYDSSTMDISDPYLIQPQYTPVSNSPVSTLGSCGFTDQVRNLVKNVSYVHLVSDPNLRYGVASH